MGLSPDAHAGREPDRPMVQIGDVLADKYVVERLLGVGGMGVVVAARHRELNELRAIKLMRRDAAVDGDAVERFLREARAAVRLKSEHAVKIHDVGRLPTGEPFMVMEYLEGQDLKMTLRRRGPLPVVETVGLTMQAIEAIAEAHAMGIVHRDLKPGNLFVTAGLAGEPVVKVLDFGISKLTGAIAAGAGMDMTKTSSMLGTPYYMSPEQMRSSRQVDVRTDVWALGVILYQLLTGRVPFKENTITALCASVLQDEPLPPRSLRHDLPVELEQVVMRCLQKKPEARYGSVGDLATALQAFGPPDARASAERVGRLLAAASVSGALGSQPSMSALGSGAYLSLPAEVEPAAATDIEQLMPTTPLRAPSVVDPSATAASWGRTGGFDRSRMPPGTKAVIAAVGVSGLVLVAFLAILLPGAPDDSVPIESADSAVAAGTDSPTIDTAVGGVPSSDVSSDQQPDDAGAAGAAADAGNKKVVRRPYRRPAPRPKPKPKPTPQPSEQDPFGSGRK